MPCQAGSSSSEVVTWLKDGVPVTESASASRSRRDKEEEAGVGRRVRVEGDNTLVIQGKGGRQASVWNQCSVVRATRAIFSLQIDST